MTFSDVARRIRVEDLLCVLEAVILGALALAGWNAAAAMPEDQYWLLNFILLPVAILCFISSMRYAIGSDPSSTGARFVHEVFGVIRDWFPFAVFLIFYAVFLSNVWQRISPATFDRQLLQIDRRLFGETPAVVWQAWVTPGRTEFFSLCYFLHLILPPFVASVCYRRNLRLFREFLLAIMIAGFIGMVLYALVPAIGPATAFPELFHTDLHGRTMRGVTEFVDRARAPRDAFPSLHVAVSAIVLYYGFRRSRWLLLILLPLVTGNWISTLYLRYHYFVDVIAGWAGAALGIAIAAALMRAELALKREIPTLPERPPSHAHKL